MKTRSKRECEGSSKSNLPRLSRKEELVLAILINSKKELFGLELVEASGGELKRGTIYVTLQRMQEKGFIESRREARSAPDIGIPLRLYRVTGFGERILRAYQTARPTVSFDPVSVGA